MAGTQTNNFDLVVELSEDALASWFSALFDGTGSQSSQGNIFEGIFNNSAFTLTAGIDRPTDVNLPASATDVVDLRVEVLGVATVRIVVGLAVDRTRPDRDQLIVDFPRRLHHVSVRTLGLPIPGVDQLMRNRLAALGGVELFGIDVDRTTSDPQEPMELDFRLIDDSNDRDAAALLINFGGSGGGNRNGFTDSILGPGETAGILVFFGWIARMIAPRIEGELGMAPGAMVIGPTSCVFDGNLVIDADEDVRLLRLAILLVDDAIRVECRVSKSGFCYNATGTAIAELTALVEDGRLKIDWNAEDPVVDISVPWYCWLAAIVLGGIVGGVVGVLIGGGLGGIIGVIAGGVIGALLTWLMTELLEGILEGIGSRAADVVNDASPDIDVAVPGLEFILQQARIDDLTIGARVRVEEYAPVRCAGTVRLAVGDAVDFDTGIRAAAGLAAADFAFGGMAGLRALCNTRVSPLNAPFHSARRFMLYGLPYTRDVRLPLDQLARVRVLPPGWQSMDRVFAYTTGEGRFGVVQVTDVSPTSATLRFRTYGEALPQASIRAMKGPRLVRWDLLDSHDEATSLVSRAIYRRSPVYAGFHAVFPEHPVAGHAPPQAKAPAEAGSSHLRPKQARAKLDVFETARAGIWLRPQFMTPERRSYRAQTSGLGAAVRIAWSINGTALDQGPGTVAVDGVSLSIEVENRHIRITSSDARECRFSLGLLAVGDNHQTARASLCVTIQAKPVDDARFIPTFREFRKRQPAAWPMALEGLGEMVPAKG